MEENRLDALSEQQRVCLRLVAANLTSKEIGKRLGISPYTADEYIKMAVTKLGVSTRREAARLLTLHENPSPQSLVPEPQTVVPAALPPQEVEAGQRWGILHLLRYWLPPVGGRENDLSLSERIVSMGQIAFAGALLLILTIVIITGVIALLR